MSVQNRIFNYGAPVDSTQVVLAQYATTAKGVYRGFDLSIDASADLTIAAGYGVQHNGVVWAEDGLTTLAFTPPAPATIYTVVATHDNVQITGGVEVEYAIQTGEVTSVANGVILGWIYHPGGSVPLATNYLLSAPKMLASPALVADAQPVELVAPFDGRWWLDAASGVNTVVTDPSWDAANFVVYQDAINNSAIGPEAVIQHVQLYHGSFRPYAFDFYVNIDADPNTNLTVEVYDTALAAVTTTGGPITGTVGWETHTVTVARYGGTFAAGAPYTLRLTSNMGIAQQVRIARVVARYWPYPY